MGSYIKTEEIKDSDWKNYRSFFFSGSGFVKLRFVEHHYLRSLAAIIDDGQLEVKHLKIYKGTNVEARDEEATYRDRISKYFTSMIG